MSYTHQIKVGAVVSYAAIIFNIVAGLIYTPWMVKVIGKSDFALYILANSFLTYFVIDFGLWQAIAKLLSKYRAEKSEGKANNLIGLSVKFYLLFDLIICITLIVIYFNLDGIFIKLTPGEIERFKIVYLIAGFFSVLSFPFISLKGIFISYSLFAQISLFDLLAKAVTIIIMVIVLLLGFGLYSLVLVTGFIGLIATLTKLYYLKRETNLRVNLTYYDRGLTKDLFRTSFWVFLIIVSELLLRNSSPTILGIFSGTGQIAIFAIAMLIDGYNTTFANAFNGFFLPKVTELHIGNADTKTINDLMIKVGRIQLVILGLVLVGFVTMGKEFIMLWMGPDYKESYFITILLIAPGLVIFTQEIPNTLLFVANKLKYRSYVYFIGGIIGVIVTTSLASKFGALGAGIGIFIASAIFFLIGMNIVYWKVLKLDILRFFLECHMKLLFPIGLALIAGFGIQYFYQANSLISFFPKVILLTIIYILLMWFLGMNRYEKQLVSSAIHKAFLLGDSPRSK